MSWESSGAVLGVECQEVVADGALGGKGVAEGGEKSPETSQSCLEVAVFHHFRGDLSGNKGEASALR